MAITSQCPVIPIYIHNSGHLDKFKRISVTYGHPIYPQKFTTYMELADEVMRQIQLLKDKELG